jgi:hypothetical protein
MKAMPRKQERTRDTTYVEHKSRGLNTQADSSQVVSKGKECVSVAKPCVESLSHGQVLGIVRRGFDGANSRIVVVEALLATESDVV